MGHAQQYPEIIELWPAPCRHGAISGDMEYLGCGPFLIVVDISVPDAPVVVNHLILESICDLETSGSYLYVSSNGLHVFDISDPASPVEVGASWVPCGYSIDVSTPLVVSVDRYLEGPARIFDVSDPTYPAQVGSWGSAAYRYREVGVQGQYAYVAFNWYDDILEWGAYSTSST